MKKVTVKIKKRKKVRKQVEDQKQSLSYHESQFLVEGIQCLQFQIGAAGRPLQREEAQGWGCVA